MEYYITEYESKKGSVERGAVLEDSIMHKGRRVTAGSKILENFVSPITATVVDRMQSAGFRILGKTKMDEFGIGKLLNADIEKPRDSEKGSEDCNIGSERSGAVAAVADGLADIALCNDYTGFVALEAARRGLFYIHPTYGTVSRYGLVSAVSSMDQIGIICKKPKDGFDVLDIISGFDEKDGAMISTAAADSGKAELSAQPTGLRIGVPFNAPGSDFDVSKISAISDDHTAVAADIEHHGIYLQVMRILCCAELSNNISRYDGIKFGYRAKEYGSLQELYTKSRTEAFGNDVKLSALIGSLVLSTGNYDKYYDKAMRIRRLIKQSLDFTKYDLLVAPHPCLARLCGLPAITVPHEDGAVTILADALCEKKLRSGYEG